jgi:uncharacterized protein YjbJ (UPF0337 family)
VRGRVVSTAEKAETEPGGIEMSLWDKVTGRAKKAAGDLTGRSRLRREGELEERKAEAKEEHERADAEADRKAAEVADLERRT